MERQTGHQAINNEFYNELKEEWYTRSDHPVALLRAENRVRIPWIIEEIGPEPAHVLDIGCGAGFLTNALAEKGHTVTGVDLSQSSLEVAKTFDAEKKVRYLAGHAYCLPFEKETFDVVCAMDVLEHVDEPAFLIAEASRVLKPGGLFFFHTFNRNALTYFLVIKGVEWFVKNTPPRMHVYSLFIKPEEMQRYCHHYDLTIFDMKGFNPKLRGKPLLHLLSSRKVHPDFTFAFSRRLTGGYCGIARKM